MRILETERLVLRLMDMNDVNNLLGIFSDPEAMRFYPSTKDETATRTWIQKQLDSYQKHGHGLWIATMKETGEFAGQCGLVEQEVDGRSEIEIGYLFLRCLWGRGLATEAAQSCRNYGFSHFGYKRLVSLIDPGNIASRRVAEKIGMTLEKQIIKWNKPICVYVISKP